VTGFLFAICGIDGSGKSTVAYQLVDILKSAGYDAIGLSEPTYQSKAGRTVRKFLDDHIPINGNELLDLFIKDRTYDVETNIVPALNDNKIVIMDRYITSSAVYEASDELSWKEILRINRSRLFPEPDVIFVLTPGVEVAWARIILRGEQISQYETKTELYRTQALYDEICLNDKRGHYINIDSSGDKPHETAQNIYGHIVKYLNEEK
jgi:dTMP kinase